MSKTKSHEGQTALVTGGTGGLGTAICRRLSLAGLKVVANHHPGETERAEQWLSTQSAEGFDFHLASADVSDYDACISMAAELANQEAVSVLVNNAGIVRDATLKNLEPHHWQAVIDTQETAAKGITVNSISPGFIDTEMVKSIPDEQRNAIVAAIPVKRIGQPQDIANAVAFLASEDSSYITGVNLAVNGGVFMH